MKSCFLYMIDFLVPLWLCKIYVQKSQGVRCVVRNDISKCSNHFPQPDTAASCSGNMSRCFTVQPLSLAYSAKGTMLSAGDRNDGMMGSRKGLLNCKVGTFPLIITQNILILVGERGNKRYRLVTRLWDFSFHPVSAVWIQNHAVMPLFLCHQGFQASSQQ